MGGGKYANSFTDWNFNLAFKYVIYKPTESVFNWDGEVLLATVEQRVLNFSLHAALTLVSVSTYTEHETDYCKKAAQM
jgi:hypothetical protein